MEDDKKSSMSDKDRKMAGRFEGFGNKKEDDEEKKGKKTSKIPKRSLFLGSDEKAPKVETPEKIDIDKSGNKNLFSGLFKDKEITVVEAEPKADEVVAEFSEVVVDRLQEVEKELEVTTSDSEALEATADAEFLENVGERLAEGMEPEVAIEDALEDVYQPPEVDARPRDLETPENFDVQPDEEVEDPVITPTPSLSIPPIPPVYNPNLQLSQPSTPNVVAGPDIEPMNDTFYRNRRTGDLLVGGTVGYLLGRNRGRNKAEGRLEPEIDKLDKKMEDLKQKLEDSERRVREEIAKAEQSEKAPVNLEKNVEKPKSVDKIEANIENIAPVSAEAEQKIVESQEKQFEAQLQAMADLEIANQAIPKVENGPIAVGEVLKSRISQETETPETHKDVRSMTMTELLEVAEHISLEKTSLRELYERNRIDAVNLRRVIIEYMNGGGRYEQMLRGSLEAVEMQRELRGEIKRESDFSGSGVVSDDDASQTGNLSSNQQSGNAGNSNLKDNSSGSSSSVNTTQDENSLLSGANAVMLGIIAGIIVTIAFVVFASL